MRKICKALIVLAVLLVPTIKGYAITLGEYEDKLNKYKAELAENQSKINKTTGEINSANNEINNLKNEVLELTKEVEVLNEEIDKFNVEIKEKIESSKELIEYLEVSSKGNMYLEYVFDASSINDLIYRSATVEELIEYNNKTIEELNKMINDNKIREQNIAKRKEEISKIENNLNNRIASLGQTKATLTSGAVTIEKELKSFDEKVKFYKSKGCKSSDVIGVDCAVEISTYGFRRPTETGYVTQNQSATHRGLDIGSKKGTGEKIYPVGDGTIEEVYKDYYGALCVRMSHKNAKDGKWYTSIYCHLSSFAPGIYVGMKPKRISSNDFLGYMGNTGYSFGNHLHIELIPCRYLVDNNCFNWNSYVNFARNQFNSGYNQRKVVNYPNGLYNAWSTR